MTRALASILVMACAAACVPAACDIEPDDAPVQVIVPGSPELIEFEALGELHAVDICVLDVDAAVLFSEFDGTTHNAIVHGNVACIAHDVTLYPGAYALHLAPLDQLPRSAIVRLYPGSDPGLVTFEAAP